MGPRDQGSFSQQFPLRGEYLSLGADDASDDVLSFCFLSNHDISSEPGVVFMAFGHLSGRNRTLLRPFYKPRAVARVLVILDVFLELAFDRVGGRTLSYQNVTLHWS